MPEPIYWLTDFCDEVVPCDCSLQGWADWLAEAHDDWGLHEPAKDGQEFEATWLQVFDDLTATLAVDGWRMSQLVPDGADFFAVRWGPGKGWDVESIAETARGLFADEIFDADVVDRVEYIACGRHGDAAVRVRFNLTAYGPRCFVIGPIGHA